MDQQDEYLKEYHIFDFKWVKILVTQCITLSLLAIIFGSISLGWYSWVHLEPPGMALAPVNTQFADRPEAYDRYLSLFYYCFNDRAAFDKLSKEQRVFGSCTYRDLGQKYGPQEVKDEAYVKLTSLRSSQVGLHASGLLLFILVTFMTLGLICVWVRDRQDSHFYRNVRMLLGVFYSLASFVLLISILLWHIQADLDKRIKSPLVSETFPNWDASIQRGTKETLGMGYAFIWVSTLLSFITSWIMLFSTCCWTHPSDKLEEIFGPEAANALAHTNKAFDASRMDLVEMPSLPRYIPTSTYAGTMNYNNHNPTTNPQMIDDHSVKASTDPTSTNYRIGIY